MLKSNVVTIKDAKEVSNVLIAPVNPVSIILFGSIAKEGNGADLDLLIVIDDNDDYKNQFILIYRCLKKFYKRFSVEPFIIPISVIKNYYAKGSPFLVSIFKNAKGLYMRNIIFEWFKQAKDELDVSNYLLNGGYFKGACFHAQQSIEKAIKALLLNSGWELEKTHNMERLLSIAEEYKINIKIEEEDIIFIDSIYRGRYPAESGLLPFGEPSKADAEKIVEIAEQIYSKSKK